MSLDFSVRVYFQGGENPGDSTGYWRYEEYERLPVSRPCVIVFHVNADDAQPEVHTLIAEVRDLLGKLEAVEGGSASKSWEGISDADAREMNWLHVLVCNGPQRATLDQRILNAAKARDHVWILPVFRIADKDCVRERLSEELAKRNVAFWNKSIKEVALTILARAGVTTLDRRAFISYRRTDASPLADQLFDALTERNFDVFLDRVSVEPGVDFQKSLFEHLSDKSMVIVLNSEDFPNSDWTMDEILFARARRLTLLILQLPSIEKDDEDGENKTDGKRDRLGATGGEEISFTGTDVEFVSVSGFQKRQIAMSRDVLRKLVDDIVRQHDVELVSRVRDIRRRILDAATQAKGSIQLKSTESQYDSSIEVELQSPSPPRKYTIFPSAYPPDVSELFEACRNRRAAASKRIVVGHTDSMLSARTDQLDWVVDQRNVTYYNIDAISLLFELMEGGAL